MTFSGAKDGNKYEVGEEDFENCLKIEKIITDKQKTLIRVGYGTWCVSTGRVEQKVLDKISHIVDANLQGIYKIGDVYGENNCL